MGTEIAEQLADRIERIAGSSTTSPGRRSSASSGGCRGPTSSPPTSPGWLGTTRRSRLPSAPRMSGPSTSMGRNPARMRCSSSPGIAQGSCRGSQGPSRSRACRSSPPMCSPPMTGSPPTSSRWRAWGARGARAPLARVPRDAPSRGRRLDLARAEGGREAPLVPGTQGPDTRHAHRGQRGIGFLDRDRGRRPRPARSPCDITRTFAEHGIDVHLAKWRRTKEGSSIPSTSATRSVPSSRTISTRSRRLCATVWSPNTVRREFREDLRWDRLRDGDPHPCSRRGSVHHLIQVPAIGNPFQLVFARVLEGETRSRHEVFHVCEINTWEGPAFAATRAPIDTVMPRPCRRSARTRPCARRRGSRSRGRGGVG